MSNSKTLMLTCFFRRAGNTRLS